MIGRFLGFIKRRWYLVLILLVVGGFVWYRFANSGVDPKKTKPVAVKRQDLVDELSFSGEIDASEKVVLRFQSSGKLTWVGVKEGDRVKKFQTLATLDQAELRKKFQRYLNTYNKARDDFEETTSDNRDYEVSGLSQAAKDSVKRLIDQSQQDLNNSVIDLELQEIALKYSYLYTPIEGLVTRVDSPNAGVNITPTTAEIEVINPKTLYFSALADQTEVTRLKEGMSAEITLDAFSESKYQGAVTSIAFTPKTGETGTVYEIKIGVSLNDNSQLRLGMTGDVSFILEEKKGVLTLPVKYVKGATGKKYVAVMTNNALVKKEVVVGKNFDGTYEILSGINEGETVYDQAL